MTALQEALPCPFCGKQHTLQVISGQELMGEDQEFWQHSESFGVVCDASTPDGKGGCGAMGGFKPTEDEAIEAWNTRTALAQHREQQPVCHGCGIPAGDVHMSTCKSGKWPSRVSNGDTAAPAPQPASEMVANFIVSAVVIKDTSTGFNTQNKLYPVSAANSDEATGKALSLVTNDFPEHRLHTMCFIQIAPASQAQEPAPQPAQWESLNLAREVLKLNALWNKSTVQAPEISDQLGICRVLAERVNTDD